MPLTAAQVRTKVDDFLATLWAKVVSRQSIYASNHGGTYWQGLVTHTTPPVDGADVAPDNLTTKPYYQVAGWSDAIKSDLPATMPCSLRIDQYVGPTGYGFAATVQVCIGSRLFERSKDSGPEPGRTNGWREVTDGP